MPRVRWLDLHRRWLDFMDATLGRSEEAAMEAQWHRAAGDAGRARDHAERARCDAQPRHASRSPCSPPIALLGILATDAGDRARRQEHFAQALALADACRAPYERALTLIAHAELLATTGEHRRARALLDEARALCLPMDALPALAQIERLAARLDATPDRPPAGLTAREVEVLRLVAAGLSNAADRGAALPQPAHGQGARREHLRQDRRARPRRRDRVRAPARHRMTLPAPMSPAL